jgi:hypothetical protein
VEHDVPEMILPSEFPYTVAMRSRSAVDEANGEVNGDVDNARHSAVTECHLPHRRAETPRAVTHHHDEDDSDDEGSPDARDRRSENGVTCHSSASVTNGVSANVE